MNIGTIHFHFLTILLYPFIVELQHSVHSLKIVAFYAFRVVYVYLITSISQTKIEISKVKLGFNQPILPLQSSNSNYLNIFPQVLNSRFLIICSYLTIYINLKVEKSINMHGKLKIELTLT